MKLYLKLPKLTTLITFGASSLWGLLLLVGSYFRERVTFKGSLLSGGRYFWRVVTFGSALLSKGRYFRELDTFGGLVT